MKSRILWTLEGELYMEKKEDKKIIVAVILNFLAYWETIKCIDSIRENAPEIQKIIVVDNASSNDSYSKLKMLYASDKEVLVIRTKKNLGFAKGNNVGIKYAREKCNAEYVLLLNSDIVITYQEYVSNLLKKEKLDTGVISSKILLPNHTGKKLMNMSFSTRNIFIDCVKTYLFDKGMIKKICKLKNANNIKRVNGCLMMLTPAFFKKYDGLYPHTFLYNEEHILTIMLHKARLTTGYAEKDIVFHNENQSAKLYFDNYDEKRQRNIQKSIWHVLLVKILPYRLIKIITSFS